jgi:hypothetical protein
MNAVSTCHVWTLRIISVKICRIKYADGFVQLSERTNGKTGHRLVEFWKQNDMENNVEGTKVMRISTQPSRIGRIRNVATTRVAR